MPWRSRYITSRQHPLAISAYLVILLLGVLFLTGVFTSPVLDAAIGPVWQNAWEWEVTLGGAGAVTGLLMRHSLDDALSVESAGALVSAFGLITYSAAIIDVAGWTSPVWLLLGVLAGGCLARAWQATRDRRRITRLAEDMERVSAEKRA